MSGRQGYKTTEIGEIPQEWEALKLEDPRVSRMLKAGGTPLRTRKEFYEGGTIPFVRIEDITKNEKYLADTELKITDLGLRNSSTWVVPEDSILFSMYASFGEAVINKVPVATNQAILAVIPSVDSDLEYLYYALKILKPRLHKFLRETTQKNLNAEIVRNLKVAFPPLPEQQKIASILSTFDEAIQKTDEIIAKTQQLKKGLMQQLLTKGIEHTRFKHTEIAEIPEEWEVARLGDVLIDTRYGTSVRASTSTQGFPILGIPNILGGIIDDNHLRYAKLRESETEALALENGDILLVRTNANPDYIGRCALFERRKGIWLFASYLIRIRPKTKRVLPAYLVRVLQSEQVRRSFLRIARTSAGNYNINTRDIHSIMICLPTDHSEQQQIVKVLSTIENKMKKERENRKQLTQLKKGLMQTLLTGKARVKVN